MNRYQYKGSDVEIFIEVGRDSDDDLYFAPYIEWADMDGVTSLSYERFATYQEAVDGANKFIDAAENMPEDEINFIDTDPEGSESYERELEKQSWGHQRREQQAERIVNSDIDIALPYLYENY